MPTLDPIHAHRHSSLHRTAVLASDWCGCFYCCRIFSPVAIEEWTDEGETAICPWCGIDSVIGSESGCPITEAFLNEMKDYWFSPD
ncbi:MAG: cytoplasmic protein [Armatimonadota bacterium]